MKNNDASGAFAIGLFVGLFVMAGFTYWINGGPIMSYDADLKKEQLRRNAMEQYVEAIDVLEVKK